MGGSDCIYHAPTHRGSNCGNAAVQIDISVSPTVLGSIVPSDRRVCVCVCVCLCVCVHECVCVCNRMLFIHNNYI